METEYTHAEAVEFVDECEKRGIRILGMDFLRRDETGITPMDSADWGDLTPEESWRESRRLLQHGIPDGGNVVIFVLDEP